jgi:hypothetical protein
MGFGRRSFQWPAFAVLDASIGRNPDLHGSSREGPVSAQ